MNRIMDILFVLLSAGIVMFSSAPPTTLGDKLSRIVGGDPVPAGVYPFMAGFLVPTSDPEIFGQCGGTLITTRHILTAAHCAFDGDNVAIGATVYINSLELRDTGDSSTVIRKVVSAKQHEFYDKENQVNDIAILTLDRPVTTITPVELASNPSTTYAGQTATIMGWGDTNSLEANSESKYLLSTSLMVLTNEECQSLQQDPPITSSQVCAGAPNRDSCVGDSGGPLLVDHVQIGIVSFGPEACASPDTSGVYTSVASYNDWINTNTADL